MSRRIAGRRRQDGFTIVELMFALVVISIFMAAIAAALGTAMRSSRSDTNRMVASNLAATIMDEVRGTDFETLKSQMTAPSDITSSKTVVDGVQYTASRTIQWVPSEGPIVNCGVGIDAGSIAFLRVDIAISWQNMGAVRPVTNSTLVSPPVGQYNTDNGAVATQVTDIDGTPQSGITATLTGPGGTQTQLTNDQGCVLFPALANGDYTVKISKPGHAYVDTSGNPTPSVTTPVTSGPVTAVPTFTYDRATTITATIEPGKNPVNPAASALMPSTSIPLFIANSYIQPTGWRKEAGTGTTLVRTLSNLYPYRDGYSVWPGTCVDSDPDAYRTGADDPSLRAPVVPVTPGEVSTVNLPLPAVAIRVRTLSGSARSNANIKLVYAGSDASCAGTSLSYSTRTDSNGRLAVAAPYGTWQIVPSTSTGGSYSPSGGPWPTVELTPQNASQIVEVTTT